MNRRLFSGSRTNRDRRDASFRTPPRGATKYQPGTVAPIRPDRITEYRGIQHTIDVLLNSGGLNGRIEAPPAPARELAPDDARRVNSTNCNVVCLCGVKWLAHFDRWDLRRFSCEEAQRRTGTR